MKEKIYKDSKEMTVVIGDVQYEYFQGTDQEILEYRYPTKSLSKLESVEPDLKQKAFFKWQLQRPYDYVRFEYSRLGVQLADYNWRITGSGTLQNDSLGRVCYFVENEAGSKYILTVEKNSRCVHYMFEIDLGLPRNLEVNDTVDPQVVQFMEVLKEYETGYAHLTAYNKQLPN